MYEDQHYDDDGYEDEEVGRYPGDSELVGRRVFELTLLGDILHEYHDRSAEMPRCKQVWDSMCVFDGKLLLASGSETTPVALNLPRSHQRHDLTRCHEAEYTSY